jgi:hypothetical protein
MTRSMARRALAGFLALAALAAVAVLDVGSATAEAAPSVSPFAGTYVWATWYAPITITDGGKISSSFNYSGNWSGHSRGSINGRVDADGTYSFTASRSGWYYDRRDGPRESWNWESTSAGTLAPDSAGNLVVTPETGASFVWTRQ